MPRPRTITLQDLAPPLRSRAPVSAVELASVLRVNRTTIHRALAGFGDQLVKMGSTRRTRYALRRELPGAGNQWPVFKIDSTGRALEWARLEALHDRLWRVRWLEDTPAWAAHFASPEGLWRGFPWFLADVRPQGFMGRAIARQYSRTLRVPEDPRQWGDEDTLVFLQAAGEDVPGNLVLGDDCLRRALGHAADPEIRDEADFPELAARAASTTNGTSAGGEQPKFSLTLRDPAGSPSEVLVKFSPPLDQATGRRWADLLLAEFHAHAVLERAGLGLAAVRIHDAGGRRFLVVPRFDRTPDGGRRGSVSLESLHAAAIGSLPRDWPTAMESLVAVGLADAGERANVRHLHAFGELIGNTDMHLGNLSFQWDDALPFRVAPAYDMLPMLWAPGPQGEIVERILAPLPPVPAMREAWRAAAGWAAEFWRNLSADERLSEEFAVIARQALAVVTVRVGSQ